MSFPHHFRNLPFFGCRRRKHHICSLFCRDPGTESRGRQHAWSPPEVPRDLLPMSSCMNIRRRRLDYLMGVLGYLMGVLGYLMGVLGYPMAWRRCQAKAKWRWGRRKWRGPGPGPGMGAPRHFLRPQRHLAMAWRCRQAMGYPRTPIKYPRMPIR